MTLLVVGNRLMHCRKHYRECRCLAGAGSVMTCVMWGPRHLAICPTAEFPLVVL